MAHGADRALLSYQVRMGRASCGAGSDIFAWQDDV